MADRPQRGGGTLIHLLGSLTEGILNLLFSIILVRLISQSDFGTWRQFLSLAAIGWNIAIFGLPSSLYFFYSTAKPNEAGTIARRTLWMALILGALGSVLFFFGLDFAAGKFDNPQLWDEALLFSSYFLLGFPLFIITPMLVAADQRAVLAMLRISMNSLKLAALAALVWLNSDLRTMLIALNVVALIQFAAHLYVYLRAAGPALLPWRHRLDEQLKFSGHMMLQGAAGQLSLETDKLLVSASRTPAEFASYSVGARELPLVLLIPYSITDSIVPNLSRFAQEKAFPGFYQLLHRWIKRVALLMYPVFALVLFQHREIVTILYTADYIDGALPLLVIGCLIPIRVASNYQLLISLGGSRDVMLASFANLALVAGLGYTFLQMFGPWGAALGLAVAEYSVNCAVLLRVAKRTETPLSGVYPWLYLFKLLLIAVGSGAAALPVLHVLGNLSLFWQLVCYGLTMMTLFCAAVLMLRMVDSDDLALLRAKLRR